MSTMMHISSLVFRGVAAMGLLGIGLTACQWVAGIEDIELTSGSSAAASSSGAGTGGTTGASSSSSSASASSSASGTGGAGPFEYQAAVADCVNTDSPDPDACEMQMGTTGRLHIDTKDNFTMKPYVGFLRFDLDNALAGRTATKVTLYLTTTNDGNAPSDKSGEIWEVEPFTRQTLSGTVPMHVGGSPLAGDFGPLISSTTYSWSLPATFVAANKSLYLGLEPTSTDYALYWNNNGTTPPKLVIEAQ